MVQLELNLGARLFVFPLAKDARRVRAIADRLDVLQGEDAAAYWRDVVTTARSELGALGFGHDEIDRQVIDLFDAVQETMIWAGLMPTEKGI